jgi:hypothetical protein
MENNPEILVKLCYRDKDRDMATYLQLRKNRDPFFTLGKLEELRHPHATNTCENFMKIITKFHPKDIQLYNTICCKGRTFGVLLKDSVGMASYLERSFAILGVEMTMPTLEYGREKDQVREYNKKLKGSAETKTRRAMVQSENMRVAYKKVLDPKMESYGYRSGIRMAIVAQEYEEEKKKKEKQTQDEAKAIELALTGQQVDTGNPKKNE